MQESEDFLIEVYDNVITLDMEKLNVEELNTTDSYFMRVPNTSAQDYIRIGKSEAEMINGGKTLKTELDLEKSYPIKRSLCLSLFPLPTLHTTFWQL